MKREVDEIKDMVKKLMLNGGVQQVRACGLSVETTHPTNACPTLEDPPTAVNPMGDYQGHRPRYEPYPVNNPPNYRYGPQNQAPYPPRQNFPTNSQGMSTEDMMRSLAQSVMQSNKVMMEHRNETAASIKNLERQVGQLSTTVSKLEARLNLKRLSSQPEQPARENVSAITLRSKKVLEEPKPKMPQQ